MSHIVENYLSEVYLYEELMLIDENLITWAKTFTEEKLKGIGEKMQQAFNRGDMQKVKSIASKIPRPSVDSLEKMAKKTSPNFKKANIEASRQISQKFPEISDTEKRLVTFIVAIINQNSDNITDGVADTVKKLKKLIKNPKVKKAAAVTGAGGLGSMLIMAAGVIGLVAFITINFPVLLLALLISGIALVFLIEAAH